MVDLRDISISDRIKRTFIHREKAQPDVHTIIRRLAQISLGLTIFFAPFRIRVVMLAQPVPSVFSDYTDLLVYLSDIFLILTLVLWGCSLILKPRRVAPGPLVLSIPLAGLIVMGWISAIFSITPLLSVYHCVRLMLLACFYLFIVNEVKDLGGIIWGVAGGIFIQSSVAIVQIARQSSLGLILLGEMSLNPAWSGVSIVWVAGTRSLRAYGLTDHPNILGGCLAFSLILLMAWMISSQSSKNLVAVSVFLLGLIALLETFSRSAWLGWIGGLLVIAGMYLYSLQFKALGIWIYLLAAGLIMIIPFLWQNASLLGVRLGSQGSFQQVAYEAQSIQERVVLDSAANEIFTGHALTGVGLGASPIALMQARPVFKYYYQPAHFILLDAATETGIFGALFYFLILIGPWLAIVFYRKRLIFSTGLIAASGALAAVTIVGFFDYYPWLLTPGRIWQWLIWGLWAAFYHLAAKKVQDV